MSNGELLLKHTLALAAHFFPHANTFIEWLALIFRYAFRVRCVTKLTSIVQPAMHFVRLEHNLMQAGPMRYILLVDFTCNGIMQAKTTIVQEGKLISERIVGFHRVVYAIIRFLCRSKNTSNNRHTCVQVCWHRKWLIFIWKNKYFL